MQIRTVVEVAKQSVADWSDDGAPRLAAALAYYTAFSLAPLLFLVVALVGFFIADADALIAEQLARVIGEDAAGFLSETARRSGPEGGLVATLIGVAVLLFGAAGVFGQLQDALNTIWEVRPKPGQGILGFLRQRLFSFALVGGTAFLLLVSLLVSTLISTAIDYFSAMMPGIGFIWQVANFLVSVGLTSVIFAVIFKVVPDAVIRWRDVWLGAAITGVLFSIGQILLGLYLGMQAADSVYGAAGSLIVVLLWVYYAAQILFFGAEITQVTARRRGVEIMPARNAERVGAAERQEQGLDRSDLTSKAKQSRSAGGWLAGEVGYLVGTAIAGSIRRLKRGLSTTRTRQR